MSANKPKTRKKQNTDGTQPTAISKRLYSIHEGQIYLGYGHTKIYDEIKKKRIKTVKSGRSRKITIEELERYVDELKKASEASEPDQDDDHLKS